MKSHKPEVAQHEALHDSASLWRPTSSSSSPSSDPADVTASTPPTPSSTLDPANFEIIWADSTSEHSDDWSDIAQDSHTIQDTSSAPDVRAMAEDFSEGRLETFVGSPQKELAGTQNAYVSYLVTTKVQYSMRSATMLCKSTSMLTPSAVRLSVLPEARLLRPPPLHRFRLSLETAHERIPAMRRPSAA